MKKRCDWLTGDEIYLEYHDKEWGAHGAGAVRSDPKSGNPSDWKNGLGPQSDEIRIYNYVRCVRNIKK